MHIPRQRAIPLDKINSSQIQAFGDAMRAKLLDRENGFSKRLLMSEIQVSGNAARMTGSKAALVHADMRFHDSQSAARCYRARNR